MALTLAVLVLSLKWRNFSQSFIYIECVVRIIVTFFPNSNSYFKRPYMVLWMSVSSLLGLYCDSKLSCVFLVLTSTFELYFGINILYSKPMNFMTHVTYLMAILILAIYCVFFILSINYISQLHNKLDFANSENVRLLNGMHEGVLIIKKPKQPDGSRRVMFCNRPAEKLLQTYLNAPVTDPQWIDAQFKQA